MPYFPSQSNNPQNNEVGVPTLVQGRSYTVPKDTQTVFKKRIKVRANGRIKIKGILVEG
jgi:hypothetical protein